MGLVRFKVTPYYSRGVGLLTEVALELLQWGPGPGPIRVMACHGLPGWARESRFFFVLLIILKVVYL